MMLVVAGFIENKDENKQATGDSECEASDVDRSINFVLLPLQMPREV